MQEYSELPTNQITPLEEFAKYWHRHDSLAQSRLLLHEDLFYTTFEDLDRFLASFEEPPLSEGRY